MIAIIGILDALLLPAVQTVMCDGSFHFVSSNIDLNVWRSLSTASGREVIDASAF